MQIWFRILCELDLTPENLTVILLLEIVWVRLPPDLTVTGIGSRYSAVPFLKQTTRHDFSACGTSKCELHNIDT